MNNPLHPYEKPPEFNAAHHIFEHCVQKYKSSVAIRFNKTSISYQELNHKANQLAHFLIHKGIQAGTLIAIAMERSPEMIIAILAIQKAGCAYVPVDPNSPSERLHFVTKDTKTPLILSQKKFIHSLRYLNDLELIAVDDLQEPLQKQSTQNPDLAVQKNDLAYCIYTSGSTGKPKGVLIEHQNLINLILAEQQFFQQPVKRFLFSYSFIFDGSVLLIFKTLLEGATLVIAEDGVEKDIQTIATIIQQEQITHLLTFPSLYTILLESVEANVLKSLESVSVAGEACPGALVKLHHKQVPSARFFNQYGPTEATVGTTIYEAKKDHQDTKTPIGKAINGASVFLLDDQQQQVPTGTAGEIYIGGKGVARAYLNRPELTKEKFIPNPYGEGRLYKTGDLARELPDGNLDFIGRADFQIKLRGYRIELGEIEAVLLQQTEVREAVVTLFGEQAHEQRLIAYLVPSKEQQITSSVLRKKLLAQLPEYMVPSNFITLDEMPLTNGGKVDRKALPAPLNDRPALETAFEAPISAIEKTLAKKWSNILDINPIGRNDKFFELGGNSLQAARFITDIQKILKENIFITSIFEHPTIASFTAMLQKEYPKAIQNITGNNSAKKQHHTQDEKLKDSDFNAFLNLVPQHTHPQNNKTKNTPAIFILAPPRSGTTLLRVMLAGHPQLFAANELQLLHFDNLKERADAYTGKFALWKEGAVRALMQLLNISTEDAKSIIQEKELQATSSQEFFKYIQGLLGDRLLVDKSPSYALDPIALQRAESIFENALYIHLHRHPYSMIKSFEKMRMHQVMYLNSHDYPARQTGELIWQQSHQNIISFLDNIPQERQFNLAYESLVADPRTAMEQLCQQFNLEFHEGLLSPYKDIDKKMTDGLYKDSKPMGDPKLLQHGKIKANLADKWKGVLEDNFLHQQTWKTATDLGYPSIDKKEKVQAPQPKKLQTDQQDIAIIGMAARFPGAKNLDEFWDNLINKKDVSRTFSAEELKDAGIEESLIKDPDYVPRGMYLENADCFDESFFGYLPKEAALMDPQHRIFLECAYNALENAGLDPQRSPLKIGVFGGVARNTYLINNVLTHPNYFKSLDDFQIGITLEKDFPATRVAYKLNLKGPAVNIQTACSTSGVAVHLACQSILTGDSDVVIVGGGRIQPPLSAGHLHKEGHALSPDGYCRTFDADANGMVRGHGMAFLVLKKLDQAIADGDQIKAVIKGTAINNDGDDKVGFTAPSVSGQSQAIMQAYQKAGINPESLSYIEAHGTGTAIGDPIEIAGLNTAFSAFTDKKQFCHIGSVKANIGHLDSGACVAGIIKTVLAMQHRTLPPLMHFEKPNPQIDFSKTPFLINQEAKPWESKDHPLRAGVSSFGLGGTNAHVVLEEAPAVAKVEKQKSHELLLFSAKSEQALENIKNQYADFLKYTNHSLSSIAYTLQTGRRAYQQRAFLVASDAPNAAQELAQENNFKLVHGKTKNQHSEMVFMFPGGGAQHTNMGLDLYRTQPVFKNAVEECLNILKEDHELDLLSLLYPQLNAVNGSIKSVPITNPLHGITLLFAIEYATAKLWESWGIVPSELIGHSLGEYTAACISGVFSLRDALALVAKRGKLFLTLEEGGMLSVALPEEEAKVYLKEGLDFAAINRPDNCVFSGNKNAIDQLHQVLEAKEVQSSRLHISVAAHSLMIEPILEEFEALLEQIEFAAPKIPIISNVSGKFADDNYIQTPAYWLAHLRQTVRFSDGIETLLHLNNRIFLEVGPGQTLCTFARQHPAKTADTPILASLRHPKERTHDYAFILKTIGQLWLNGTNINSKALHHNHLVQKVSMPGYPFARNRHWIRPKHTQTTESYKMTSHSGNNGNEAPKTTRKSLVLRDIKDIFHQLSGMEVSQMNDQATFLEMGFDSLFLTQAVAKIKKLHPVNINFRQLFEEAPNFTALTDYIESQLPEDSYQEELQQLNKMENTTPLIPPSEQAITTTKVNYHLPTEQQYKPVPADGSMQSIIQQQLQLMQQQLALLGGQNTIVQVPTPPPSEKKKAVQPTPKINGSNGLAKPVETPAPQKAEATKNGTPSKAAAHGPWKPISKKNDRGLTDQQERYLKDLIQRYTERTKGSQQLTQDQRKHLADPRSITGFNRLWKDMVYQIAVDRSKGSKLWDVDGNEYIDYRNAFGISLFGHTPDFVQEAIKAQVDMGFELGVLTPLAKKVADLLCELSGCERATFVNTGSEALVAAVRAARTVTMKDKVIVFTGDYHGIADEMLVRAVKMNGRTKAMPVAPGIPTTAVQNIIVLDYDDPKVLERIKAHVHEVAAVLIEPVQPNNPARQPKELFHQIRKLTAEHDVAMIFDEMITGFRVAPRGAQEWYDVQPDLIAYGKIISGGLPMAAVAGKAKFMDAFDGGQWSFGDDSYPEVGVTFFGGTFVKHPLSLASAYAALSEIKKRGPKIYEELNAKTARFAKKLGDLFLQTKVPLRVHSTASVVSIQSTEENPLSKLLFFYLRLKGIHITEKAALVSLAHTEEDLQHTLDMFEESIKEMQTAGFFKITVAEVDDQNRIIIPSSHQTLPASVTPPAVQKTIPLTDGQKEIWVEQQLGESAAAAYNLGSEFRFKGSFKVEQLEKAFEQLIIRHEALRADFSASETVQQILSHREVSFAVADISELSAEDQQLQLESMRFNEGEIPFDIFNETPFRATLVKTSETEHYFFFTVHHIIADGWSMGVLMNDLAKLFTATSTGVEVDLPEAKQISEFVEEQANNKNSQELKAAEAYWLEQFESGIPQLEFPTDRTRPASKTYNSELIKNTIDPNLFTQLRQVATQEKTTFFNLIYTAFQTFIHRLSNQEDFVLGITSAAQAMSDNPHMVTHGVNLLPIRLQTNPEASFADTLYQTKNKVLDAFEHQSLAFGSLVKKLKVPRDPSRTPIISILFNMDSPIEALQFGNLEVEMHPVQRHYETFDIFINVKPTKDSVLIEWIYNTDLFDAITIERRLAEFETLLQSIAQNPKAAVHQLNLLPDTERQLLINTWNETTVKRPERVIHQYLEEQAVTTPNAIAIADANRQMTYHDLNQRANQVAHYFVAQGVHTGNFVGVCFDRTVDMIVALLACMKVGAIYVPLDPVNPTDRLKTIVEDAQADFLITEERLIEALPSDFPNVICMDRDEAKIRGCSTSNLFKKIRTDHLVYVNYTSGSTGKPKGVLIPHYAVVDHHLAIINALGLSEQDKIFSVASIAFDPSVQDFFLPLMIGAQVYIASNEEKVDGFKLKEALTRVKPTLMQATPSTWRMLLLANWEGNTDLTILCGGEGLSKDLSNKLIPLSNRLYNIYGPTETTIWSTLQLLEGDRSKTKLETTYEPIGRPLENVQIYLLDKKQNPVPIGAAGEIYVGGIGVAPKGYFKREALNAEKFIQNPFAGTPGERLYRTGDVARYLSDGKLEYLNRADTQVKIRGYRIELGEIESAIDQLEAIRENVVIIREDQPDNKRLVAYCIPQPGVSLDSDALKKALKAKLPDYMVPVAFVAMEKFPLTATMKINRSQLPLPEAESLSKKQERIAPESKNEKLLHELWSELLGISKISIDEDFFELGGHSLIAVNMIAQVEKLTGKKIPLASLLENSTIQKLAHFLSDEKKIEASNNSSLVPIKPEGTQPPLYLVHGAGLHVLMFQTLAANMDDDQPLYALQARGLNGEAEPFSRLEDIAAHYLMEIEEQNPNGPYRLAGYSFGGLIAFEMAKQLKAKGKEVEMLAMFDTIVRSAITGQPEKENYFNRLSTLGKKVAWNISILAKDPIPNLKYKSHVLKRRYQRWVGQTNGGNLKEADAIYGGKVDQANKEAFENYTITPYDGKIHLFRAKSKRFYVDDFKYLGWAPYAKDGVEIYDVPGDHLTLFDPPHGPEFARILQQSLNHVKTMVK